MDQANKRINFNKTAVDHLDVHAFPIAPGKLECSGPLLARVSFQAILLCGILMNSLCLGDDGAVFREIRDAWQARQDHSRTLRASWSRSEESPRPPGTPADPQGNDPRIEHLWISGSSLRHESDSRRFDIDGGPRGSMSWQTGTFIETYNPKDNWRNIVGSDCPAVRSSGTINRPPMSQFSGMHNRSVLCLWFRGLDEQLTYFRLSDWHICRDDRFVHPSKTIVTLRSGEENGMMTLLFLDKSKEYIPVGSQSGKWPSDNAPLRNFDECMVEVEQTTDAIKWRPTRWTSQSHSGDGQLWEVMNCQLQNLQFGEDHPESLFKVEFPQGLQIYDQTQDVAIRDVILDNRTAD